MENQEKQEKQVNLLMDQSKSILGTNDTAVKET